MDLKSLQDYFRQNGIWITPLLTFTAVLVALFKEEIQRIWRKPKLEISVETQPPDCHIIKTIYQMENKRAEANCFYLRLCVKNKGNVTAKNVQVFASKLLGKNQAGKFIAINDFLPMNLKWAHTKEIFRDCIAPKMERHCDLGHISDPKHIEFHGETKQGIPLTETVLFLELEVLPLSLVSILPSGSYKLELIAAADNARPIKRVLEVFHSGAWFDNEKEMFEKGVRLKLK